ncbi:MAG: 4-hydroxybenzoate transporter PcaK [Pseudomonadota bacterium]|jgi:AAHS family 4-hydroxybenzoate transporter-like MFS transporter
MNRSVTETWSLCALGVVAMVAVALMLDGLDAQVLGLAIPALTQEWGVTRAELTPITAGSLVGMAIGATFGGWFGDRFGRRAGLIGSLLLFGVSTALASRVDSLPVFGLLRALAGLGLGAALPNGTALITEFTPARYRSVGASIAMLSQPVGSLAAGLLAAALIESVGWRGLFLIGGFTPLVVALVYLKTLPESPQFLAGRRDDGERASPRALLAPALRRDSILLWLSGFMSLLALYTMLSWGPAMLASEGYPLSFAGSVVATFSVGGITGSLLVGVLARRIGSRATQGLIGGVGIAAALVLILLFSAGRPSTGAVLALMACVGFSAAGSQTTLYVLSSHLYPTWLRGTGIGATLGLGRLGAVASAWAGSTALDLGGAGAFFSLFALSIAVATTGCMAISNQVRT